jgi:IS30 family transposase
MPAYCHLSSEERDVIASMRAEGRSCRAIARQLRRAPSTISRELRRYTQELGAWRPHLAEAAYRRRRQRPAVLEADTTLAAYVVARLAEGWTPEQVAGWLKRGIERGLRTVCTETIYAWLYRTGQAGQKLWRFLVRKHGRRRPRGARASRDTISDKIHISERSAAADARAEVGHWEADLVICKRARPLLVLHERKTRLTLMTRLAGKTAGETVAAMMAMLRRLDPRVRASVTFDNDTCFARHAPLRAWLSATTYFCDAYASWQKGGIENINGRIRRWLPRGTDLDAIDERDIQEIAMTLNLTPRKCLGFLTPLEAFAKELGKRLHPRFA